MEEAGRIIHQIYEAAADPELWQPVLGSLSKALSGAAVLTIDDRTRNQAAAAWAVGLDPNTAREYNDHYARYDLHLIRARPLLKTGFLFTGPQLVSRKELLRSEYYNDFLRRYEILHFLGCSVLATGTRNCLFSSWRSPRAFEFGSKEIQLMNTLLPHLRRATRFNQVFSELRANTDAVNSLATGVVVVDDRGEVISINRAADEILHRKDGLRFVSRSIKADSGQTTRQLEAAVMRAIQTSMGHGTEAGGALRISRPSGRRDYTLIVSPVSSADAFPKSFGYLRALTRQPAAVIFITDPDKFEELDEAVLCQHYGLTPSESHIAVLLTQGKSVGEIRGLMSITANTAKTHLKRLFDKVGVRRQGELVSVLLRSRTPVQGLNVSNRGRHAR